MKENDLTKGWLQFFLNKIRLCQEEYRFLFTRKQLHYKEEILISEQFIALNCQWYPRHSLQAF